MICFLYIFCFLFSVYLHLELFSFDGFIFLISSFEFIYFLSLCKDVYIWHPWHVDQYTLCVQEFRVELFLFCSVLSGGWYCPPPAFGNDILIVVIGGGRYATGIEWLEARDATTQSTMHRMASHNKKSSTNVSSAGIEKLRGTGFPSVAVGDNYEDS